MKVGIWLDEALSPERGGGFSYVDKLIKGIDSERFRQDIVFLGFMKSPGVLNKPYLRVPLYCYKLMSVLQFLTRCRGGAGLLALFLLKFINHKPHGFLASHGVDVIYYPSQYQCVLPDYPFILSNWDLAHSSMGVFPEIVNRRSFTGRKDWYDFVIYRATAVFVESDTGKQEFLNYTTYDPKRLYTIPLFAAELPELNEMNASGLLTALGLCKHKYLFYPAQFWAHKNHVNLLKAFAEFNKQYADLKLVFTGSDKGNKSYVQELVETLGLADKVAFLGFVSTEEMSALYGGAMAMVMPSFLGPTNMPLLEAQSRDCPVLCSDFDGHREMLGDGALYFDPRDTSSLVTALEAIVKDEARDDLLEKAAKCRAQSCFTIEVALKQLDSAFEQLSSYRGCWR